MLGVKPSTGQVLGPADTGHGPAVRHLALGPPTGHRVREYDSQGPLVGGLTTMLAAVGEVALPSAFGALQAVARGVRKHALSTRHVAGRVIWLSLAKQS